MPVACRTTAVRPEGRSGQYPLGQTVDKIHDLATLLRCRTDSLLAFRPSGMGETPGTNPPTPSHRHRQLRNKRRRDRLLQPPANRHRPLAFVAHVVGKTRQWNGIVTPPRLFSSRTNSNTRLPRSLWWMGITTHPS